MEIPEIPLILTAFLVSSGLTIDAHSNEQVDEAATSGQNGGFGIQKTLRHLFESIFTEDKEKSETYRTILQQEAGKERQMFDTIREELQSARPRRAHVQKSLRNRNREAPLFKRETELATEHIYHGRSKLRDLRPGVNPANTSTMEDEYNAHFGNNGIYRRWQEGRKYYMEDGEPLMRKFCREAHRLAGKGSYPVDWMVLRSNTLKFKNPKYYPKQVDVVEYGIHVQSGNATTEATTRWAYREVGDKWQITEGVRPDCVYYLNLESGSGRDDRVFSLKELVCGISIVDDTGRLYFV